MDARDDRQLILECRKGEDTAYRALLSRYEGYIYSLSYRLTGQREEPRVAHRSVLAPGGHRRIC